MMKKYGFLMLSWVIASGGVQAQTAAVPGPAGVSTAQVGIVAAVRGAVEVAKTGRVGKVVGSGEAIFLGDEIRTDEKGTLQILLLDETIFTVGPNSRIVIDEFVYDPASGEGVLNATAVEGVFRFVTGKIARKKPEKMEVKVPHGSIGVRGTIFGLETRGGNSLGVLLGPGVKHNTPHREGSFMMKSGGKETVVERTGYGAEIGPGGELSKAYKVPEAVIRRMTSALSMAPAEEDDPQAGGGQGGEGGEGESATEASGQATAGAAGSLGDIGAVSGITQVLEAELVEASRDAADASAHALIGIFGDISTYEQLRSVQSGIFHYFQHSVPLYDFDDLINEIFTQVGEYMIQYDIDFGTRKVGGGSSKVVAEIGPDTYEFLLPSDPQFHSFSSGSGEASFAHIAAASGMPHLEAVVFIEFNNSGGVIAASMNHLVGIFDNLLEETLAVGSNEISGGAAERFPGPSSG